VSTALAQVGKRLEDSKVRLCAQNCHFEDKGAFTGEVSAPLLADVGCAYVIVGHSERRALFGESDEIVGKKAKAVLRAGLATIVCVGETLAEREAGTTTQRVGAQLDAALAPLAQGDAAKLVIAYEPVWAIGTGKTATPAQAEEVHAFIRKQLAARWGQPTADALRIQYGGSVKADNAAELMGQPNIDGALVGGASLKAEDFVAICKAARPAS
jgi:triosephosphate isomerase